MAATVTKTSKGVECLIVDGFKYRRVQRANPDQRTWRCCQRMCPAQCVTDAGDTVISRRGDHSHSPLNDREREKVIVSAACKRAAVDSYDCRPRKIIRKEVKGTDHLLKPDTVNIAKSMYRAKRKVLPTLPKTRDEAVNQIEQLDIRTSKGELFRFVKDGIILFSCATNLRLLADSKTWLGDGTFEFSADKFLQLYTIHSHHDGFNVPVASFCLPNKKGTTYISMFEMLRDVARTEANVELNPTEILLDFEDATKAAVSKVFPNITVRACRFHFTQNLVKRIRAKRALLKIFNQEGNEKGQWLHGFLGLPCLPPDMVPDAFTELMAHAPEEAAYTAISDYVLNTYIDASRYCPTLWARAPSLTDPTSTNAAENFNGKYNDGHTSAHPNIHRTTQALLEHQEDVYILERTIRAGIKFQARSDNRRIKELTMEAWEQYQSGSKSLYEYLVYVGSLNRKYRDERKLRQV